MKILSRDIVTTVLSKELAPAIRVASGERIAVKTYDCFRDQLLDPEKSVEDLDFSVLNPATGPIFVEGAEPGDTLRIEIAKITLAPMGVTEIDSSFGCLAGRVERAQARRIPIENGKARFSPALELALKPMIGVIGVAPAGAPVPTDCPGEHGGNLDCTQIGEGASLFLPVAVPGALLALGDLHACMGDGEIGGCGLEIAGEVELTATVLKNVPIPCPVVMTADAVIAVVSRPTVEQAWQGAVEALHDLLRQNSALSSDEAVMLLSLAGDLAVCQTVNPLKTVRMAFPRRYAEAYGFRLG